MLRVAMCDDDTLFTSNLETLVRQQLRSMRMRAETEVFSDGCTLLADMEKGYRYDLIFMDIEMKHVDGIATARRVKTIDPSVLFIYISGYEKYLKELFEVEPFRFLSKPLNTDKFNRYFREACQRITESEVFYQFTFNKEIHKIALRNIIYFESNNRMIYITLSDGTVKQFYGKLNDVEHELSMSQLFFLRIHQSFLVNYNYIKKMNFTCVTISIMEKEMELKISEDRQKQVRKSLCEIAEGKAIVK